MRGHKTIHRYRSEGYHPKNILVFVAEQPARPMSHFNDPENLLPNEMRPEVWVYPEDVLDPLNFRFAYRAVIHLSGKNEPRVRAVARALLEGEPKQIFLSVGDKFEVIDAKVTA